MATLELETKDPAEAAMARTKDLEEEEPMEVDNWGNDQLSEERKVQWYMFWRRRWGDALSTRAESMTMDENMPGLEMPPHGIRSESDIDTRARKESEYDPIEIPNRRQKKEMGQDLVRMMGKMNCHGDKDDLQDRRTQVTKGLGNWMP